MLVPDGIDPECLPTESVEFVRDRELSYEELDRSQGVLTTCAAAIAISGTIVLRHSASEGRRALTLIPDYHLCIVHASQVVETVAEGIRALGNPTEPITTISGPSATCRHRDDAHQGRARPEDARRDCRRGLKLSLLER